MTAYSLVVHEWKVWPETKRLVTEGVWYADRNVDDGLQHGMWWTWNENHAVSLVHGVMDHNSQYEYHLLHVGPSIDVDRCTCKHADFEGAEACALHMIRTGHSCGEGLE
jgi:hypothetical protein